MKNISGCGASTSKDAVPPITSVNFSFVRNPYLSETVTEMLMANVLILQSAQKYFQSLFFWPRTRY